MIVSLVMLAVLLIIVATLVGTSNINFRIAANQQYRMEAKHAGQHAIEEYISNVGNFTLPLPTIDDPIGYDVDGDGTNEYIAVVPPPSCVRTLPLKVAELDFDDDADAPCFGSSAVQDSGILGATGTASGNSWCSRMTWDVAATVDDEKTGVDLTVHQGVYLRALIGTSCPS